jgi:photosystem II stability/assembly factor-like uncharacterized protein
MHSLLNRASALSLTALLALASVNGANAANAAEATPKAQPAARVAHALQAKLLAAALAGNRIVAVGDHGVVMLSDDEGKSWRQAKTVPVDVQFNAVSFVDERQGWAVGHWGMVLRTEDGGESWTIQRQASQEDRPLFGVHFFDAQNGVAVGLWSLVLTTSNGGKSWAQQTLAAPAGAKKADLNLYGLFAGERGDLYATSERGTLLHSTDRGQSWNYIATGYRGSFWTGAGLADGSVVVAGLRGTIYRSPNGRDGWAKVESGTSASIPSIKVWRVGGQDKIVAAAVDGTVLRSADAGASFKREVVQANAPSLTALVVAKSGQAVLLSRDGPLKQAP